MDLMQLHRLHLTLTDQSLTVLAREHLTKDLGMEDLEIRVKAEGVHVKGSYQMFLPVTFESLWEVGVENGVVTARLANFRTLGMAANVLKSLIMNLIADAAKKEP